ncbi:MAG TPA: DUF4258 domain-containing protein [Hanamia sp.]|nr:DUF4258 domain-containing protein [Hanamia sp.]
MDIQIPSHTLQRAEERGATKAEIIEVIETGTSILSKYGRLAKSKVFPFDNFRIKKFYDEKKIEVYYMIEDQNIITVTVYVFYGKF